MKENIKIGQNVLLWFLLSVTSLPRDRLSQVTRRGMITETKSHTKLGRDGQSEEQERKTRRNKSPSGGIERGGPRMKAEGRAEVDPLEPNSELSRLLDLEESESNAVRNTYF